MLATCRHLLSLIRFSHTIFALPFALFAAILAWREPDTPFTWRQLLGVLVCMVTARSAAMAFNRLVDRHYDAANPRTAQRHLPAGILSVSLVAWFTLLSCVGFLAGTLLFLPNPWPWRLAVPVLLFLLGYSYAKRVTMWCHYWLSSALMLSPLAAWLAIRGRIEPPAVWLAAMIFFWVGGFDILYATQDAEFDRRSGLHSIPARWGIPRALKLAALSHLLSVVCLWGVWWSAQLGMIFFTGIVLVAVLLWYEHTLVRPDDLTRVNVAFFQVNALISLGLLVIGVVDVCWPC
ncbi:MAG: 4-hydroxybenzoate octaprenyltransferase [Planctomycetaceae bacterium]|nr:MAG: 4-hydroxybenzoate octaprenyltransferase [Planctomycetaceae bacterium]